MVSLRSQDLYCDLFLCDRWITVVVLGIITLTFCPPFWTSALPAKSLCMSSSVCLSAEMPANHEIRMVAKHGIDSGFNGVVTGLCPTPLHQLLSRATRRRHGQNTLCKQPTTSSRLLHTHTHTHSGTSSSSSSIVLLASVHRPNEVVDLFLRSGEQSHNTKHHVRHPRTHHDRPRITHLTVTSVASLVVVNRDRLEPAPRRRQLEGPQKVVCLAKVWPHGIQLVNEVLDANNAILAEGTLDDAVVCQGDALPRHLAKPTLVHQLTHRLEVRVAIEKIRIYILKTRGVSRTRTSTGQRTQHGDGRG